MSPSYAAVATHGTTSPPARPPVATPAQAFLAEQAALPAPRSLTLVAALQLLQPLTVGQTVYLLPPPYVQNWLLWAYHQDVPAPASYFAPDAHDALEEDDEGPRVRQALRLAALALSLVPPTTNLSGGTKARPYEDPSPLDVAATLAVEGHPLVLAPTVRLFQGHAVPSTRLGRQSSLVLKRDQANGGIPRHRASSPPPPSSRTRNDNNNNKARKECVAVPEAFYETLRRTHGVVCDDSYTVSFQAERGGGGTRGEFLLLHHEIHTPPVNGGSNGGVNTDGWSYQHPRPVEFRRKVIWQSTAVSEDKDEHSDDMEEDDEGAIVAAKGVTTAPSLMQQLMQEEVLRNKPSHEPGPEIHPNQFLYRITRDGKALSSTPHGWTLLSAGTAALDALSALLRAALPTVASHSVRLWTKRDYTYGAVSLHRSVPGHNQPTAVGDAYEWVDLATLVARHGNTKTPDDQAGTDVLNIGQWVAGHFRKADDRQMECLFEVRPAVHAPWPRQSLLLMSRLKVGDHIDAQDIAGQWYEARVMGFEKNSDEEASDHEYEKVKVHYLGWASRWNAFVPLVKGKSKLSLPVPLWSRSGRWRENIREGDLLEVRDSSSIVERPKWYRGIVKKVGAPDDPVHDRTGGADLEGFPVTEGSDVKKPLLLLGRTQQVLVEVKQERTEKAGSAPTPVNGDVAANPPFLRWVSLYGEEICRIGTHLKKVSTEESRTPMTITYEYESGRKPVEIMKGHPSLGAGFMRESIRGAPPAPGSVGLQNLGNSCFLNSTVQCLSHLELFTQYFMRERYEDDLNGRNPLGSGGQVATAYASLLKKVWGGEHSVLAPRQLKQTVAAFAPQFNNTYQHDSQEFCQFLMDGLHEDLNRVKTKPYVEELEGFGMEDDKAAIESWRKHLLRHDSVVVDHCQGMHRSHLTCPKCGRESIKFDVYSSISLPLAAKKDHSMIQLTDCIERFMEGEQLDERNAWYCPRCRQHVCALKMIALWTIPDILILHLKRFTFEPNLLSGGMLRSKVDDTVSFPIENMDLSKYVLGPIDPDAPPVYKLIGVSEHTGPTANSGHYTATVRNSIDGQWYRCNDSHVGRTSGEAAITGGAYLLFYQRSKGSTRWAGLERAIRERGINPHGGLEVDQDGFKKVKAKKKKK